MNKYLKKFGIMFVMALILSLGFCVSAFADDGGVIGTSNLNNTAQNSATVGKRLTAPEIGWKRYDDTNSKIMYQGSTSKISNSQYYKGAQTEGKDWQYEFYFMGTKLNIIGNNYPGYSGDVKVNIDGVIESFPQNQRSQSQTLSYTKKGLDDGIHKVVVTASSDGYFAVDAIEIDDSGELIAPAIELNNSTINLNVGDSQQLTVTTTPVAEGVTWTSSDPSIATVDENGNITGVKEGSCIITATTADGLTATCTVNVNKENESITLDKSSMDLTEGDSGQLTATVSTTTSAQVTWTSSDPSVATVDSTGKVTAIGVGTATITATTTDGSNLSASCAVNVTANSGSNNGGTTTGASAIVNIAYAKGDNTNNAGGDVSIIFNGVPDTTLSVVKTASVKSVWVGDTFTYTIVVTNTGSKTAKAVVINDSAPNHIQFMPSGITTTQGTVDPSSSASKIVVNVGDIPPLGTVTITVPATVVL